MKDIKIKEMGEKGEGLLRITPTYYISFHFHATVVLTWWPVPVISLCGNCYSALQRNIILPCMTEIVTEKSKLKNVRAKEKTSLVKCMVCLCDCFSLGGEPSHHHQVVLPGLGRTEGKSEKTSVNEQSVHLPAPVCRWLVLTHAVNLYSPMLDSLGSPPQALLNLTPSSQPAVFHTLSVGHHSMWAWVFLLKLLLGQVVFSITDWLVGSFCDLYFHRCICISFEI